MSTSAASTLLRGRGTRSRGIRARGARRRGGDGAPGRQDPFARRCARLGPALMRDLALTDVQAAGLLGNLGHETGGFRHLQEIAPAIPGSRGGWGIAQWTGPRRIAMETWSRDHGLDPASDAANEGYLRFELTTSEVGALAALRRAPSLDEATAVFCRLYERPGIPALPARLAWARRALAAIRAAAPEGPVPPPGDPMTEPDPPRSGPPPFPTRKEAPMIRVTTALSTFASFVCAAPALAAQGAVTLPWGDWIASALAAASSAIVPVAAAAVTAGVARAAPWATSILTRQRIESAIRAGVDYGQNAVAGAVRGRSVSVDLGPAVVAAGTRHVIATSPGQVVRKAGGVAGVATRIFRALPLDGEASAETVLAPALRLLGADGSRRA